MNCGCCACLSVDAGIATPNRPGLSAISRRIGTHGSLYERMIAGLSALDPLTAKPGALAGLTTREKNDPSIAFLDAWATCGDVLAFYQERISGCFAFIGVSHADWQTRHNVHHPKFKVDESALPIGAALHVAMALEAFARGETVST